jgi:SLT domain-containing protein
VKRLKALIFVLALVAAPAAAASAQQMSGGPVFDMQGLYRTVGYMYNIDPELLAAIATAESAGNPNAVSPKGAEGLMQLMPDTAHHYRVDNPFDPIENVLGAARFLTGLRAWSKLQAPYGEVDLPAMIAAYNAGPGAVEKYGGIPPYAETQAYVRRVLWLYLLGEPTPRRLNPIHTSAHAGYAQVPPPSPQTAAQQYAANPAPRAQRPRSVFDQLAEIKRKRDRAKPSENATRAKLHIN